MRTEDKVASIELSKRMKELGWDYETERYWEEWVKRAHTPYKHQLVRGKRDFKLPPEMRIEYIPAPDAIEIGERLPEYFPTQTASEDSNQSLLFHKQVKHYVVSIHKEQKFVFLMFYSKNEAEVKGLMWCYLKEKGLI